MAGNLNKVQLIGRLGRDPEERKFSNGGSVVTFPLATSETWRDRNSGERREKTDWHRVAIFSEPLKRIALQYIGKGDQVYLEGKLETRSYTDQSGQERYMTEVVLRPFGSAMEMLGGRKDGRQGGRPPESERNPGHPESGYSAPAPGPDRYRAGGPSSGSHWGSDEPPF